LSCHVQILDKYLQKIPPEAIEADNFYLTPVSSNLLNHRCHGILRHLWEKTLSKMMKEISLDANLSTNHSLRAYGTTTMYQAGVPEKIIQVINHWTPCASMREQLNLSS